jgi:hypothetical protein
MKSMYVLMEVEADEESDQPSRLALHDDDGYYFYTRPENVYDDPVKLFNAVIKLLITEGYDPKYGRPTESNDNTLFLSAFIAEPKWVSCAGSELAWHRFTITPPKSEPEKSEMEKWCAEVREVLDRMPKCGCKKS